MKPSAYELIDSGHFKKLERFGDWVLERPSPQALWRPNLGENEWAKAHGVYIRKSGGEGYWEWKDPKKKPKAWTLKYGDDLFLLRPTDFGHLGIFVEQKPYWAELRTLKAKLRTKAPRESLSFLNLFAYTGGSTLALADEHAEVVHVDASKSSNAWAKENADLRGLGHCNIRFITEDVLKFVEREQRRRRKYHGIVLDPPSFGRGPKQELWKIERDLLKLLDGLKDLLSDDLGFFFLSSHSAGYTPRALTTLVKSLLGQRGGSYEADEMLVYESRSERVLPSGAYALYRGI